MCTYAKTLGQVSINGNNCLNEVSYHHHRIVDTHRRHLILIYLFFCVHVHLIDNDEYVAQKEINGSEREKKIELNSKNSLSQLRREFITNTSLNQFVVALFFSLSLSPLIFIFCDVHDIYFCNMMRA
jgi:hypothetical protein